MTYKTDDPVFDSIAHDFQDAFQERRMAQRLARSAAARQWEAMKKLRKYIVRDFGKKHYEVMKMRFGEYPATLEEVGRELNITRERVRQLEGAVIEKYGLDLLMRFH